MSSSANIMSSDRVCYVHCNFCNTILAVSVPIICSSSSSSSSMLSIVTVRCGHCANLFSVNMGPLLHSQQHFQLQKQQSMAAAAEASIKDDNINGTSSSSNYCNNRSSSSSAPLMQLQHHHHHHQRPNTTPICPPPKRQRVPSAYNRFIKEEIQRIKASNPEISHRQAFSAAAKNWAHFPHIHFGLKFGANGDAGEEGTQKTLGLY